ncbi:MAG TPA: ATP-binding protein [Acidimicrobiales bacterium]|nr:ATP-binding protein [Acidimicrobiales bacterium]
MQRRLIGSLVGVLAAVAVGALMLPIRSHIAIATAALVLIIPVVAGVTVGGWVAGLVSVLSGFVVYDYAFIPPYYTLTVGSADNWAALVVYAVVMTVVARLVAHLHDAEAAATSRAETARHLLDLSELLLTESPALGPAVVASIRDAFDIEGVTLVQSVAGRLEAVASAGAPISREQLSRLRPEAHLPVPLTTGAAQDTIQTLALASSGRPVGLLVLKNSPSSRAVREALPILANHLAIALERTALQERAHRAELLEEIDRLRQALVGAISHDLRTPLATIKVASSTLALRAGTLPAGELAELHDLIDQQADRLTRLVNNLLDMTRIQTGALEVHRRPAALRDLIADALGGLASALGDRVVEVVAPEALPEADADPLLIGQVLANLLDNANRHAPPGTPITVEVAAEGGELTVAVDDRGAGVPVEEREAIFETFVRFDTGGRSGLGLAIAKAFVEAHGNRIWVEEAVGGGARFVFTLPEAPPLDGGPQP